MSTTPSTNGTVRAVFLDVDGTYADYGVVPEGHVRAVQAARKAGHRVLLCTRRPVAMLPEGILAAGFDGLVASAGAYWRWTEQCSWTSASLRTSQLGL